MSKKSKIQHPLTDEVIVSEWTDCGRKVSWSVAEGIANKYIPENCPKFVNLIPQNKRAEFVSELQNAIMSKKQKKQSLTDPLAKAEKRRRENFSVSIVGADAWSLPGEKNLVYTTYNKEQSYAVGLTEPEAKQFVEVLCSGFDIRTDKEQKLTNVLLEQVSKLRHMVIFMKSNGIDGVETIEEMIEQIRASLEEINSIGGK